MEKIQDTASRWFHFSIWTLKCIKIKCYPACCRVLYRINISPPANKTNKGECCGILVSHQLCMTFKYVCIYMCQSNPHNISCIYKHFCVVSSYGSSSSKYTKAKTYLHLLVMFDADKHNISWLKFWVVIWNCVLNVTSLSFICACTVMIFIVIVTCRILFVVWISSCWTSHIWKLNFFMDRETYERRINKKFIKETMSR